MMPENIQRHLKSFLRILKDGKNKLNSIVVDEQTKKKHKFWPRSNRSSIDSQSINGAPTWNVNFLRFSSRQWPIVD